MANNREPDVTALFIPGMNHVEPVPGMTTRPYHTHMTYMADAPRQTNVTQATN